MNDFKIQKTGTVITPRMGFRAVCVLMAVTLTCYSADGQFVPERQSEMQDSPLVPTTSVNTMADMLFQELQSAREEIRAAISDLNALKKGTGLITAAQTNMSSRIDDLQSARNEIRSAQSQIDAMKKDAALASDTQANMAVRINQAEAGLELSKLSAISCPPKSHGRPALVGVMKGEDSIGVNEKFCSQNGKTCLFMQGYMNPILYETATYRTLWSLNEFISPLKLYCHSTFKVQGDGKICIYDNVQASWCVPGESGAELTFQSDGHLCFKNPKSQSCKWTTRR